ncbi:MAG: enoyl-[acyl-carrier-protein] reductase FabI [Myxococcales bacterium]|mgnify:CR=1 FL=1|nr:enoyl-[acyl-carrier-protein] reductase FabI [Myxococcales bacterium]
MLSLSGRVGLIFGVANQRSIAWAAAEKTAEYGASVAVTYQGDRLARTVDALAKESNLPLALPCDVTRDEDIDGVFESVSERFGRIDFIVHSVAFAPKEALTGRFTETSRTQFQETMDISAYSLVKIAQRGAPLMSSGGAIVAMSYIGAERVIPNYNVMGPAKAALEANIRYLAHELGPAKIRVNAVSAGPVRTLAAAGIPGFRTMLSKTAEVTPLRRNITTDEVAQSIAFLVSDMSSGITGEIIHVDAGFHIQGASLSS